MLRGLLITAFLLSVPLGLAACSNTLDGAGQDIQKAGKKISDAF